MSKINKEEAIQKMKGLEDKIDSLKNEYNTLKSPEFKKWKRKTEITLKYIFGEKSGHIKEFMKIYFYPSTLGPWTDNKRITVFQNDLENAKVLLNSMIEEIEEYWEEDISSNNINKKNNIYEIELNKDVFIVHGHDETLKEMVARFLTDIDLNPIILHEQPNKGRTIIEKFEDHSKVSYAIVLLTTDDICSCAEKQDTKRNRPRQNVIFEFGYFIGKLGRKMVCGLKRGEVEIPSDYSGVLYIDFDKSNWKVELIQEMNAVGFKIDANNLLK